MKKLLAGAAALPFFLGFGVSAQEPATPPQAVVQPNEFVLTLTPDETNTIGDGLMELPMKKAMPILQKLRDQVSKQVSDAAKKSTPPPTPPPESPK